MVILQKLIILISGLPSLTDYLSIPENLDPEKIFSKFVEVTTDVFFNIPSFLTADFWGKFAPSFLYQFKHANNLGGGKIFLKPLPLVGKNNEKKTDKVAHGDDLSYLFNPCDVFGNRINGTEVTPAFIKFSLDFLENLKNFS